jgi:hypothetical protein
MKDAVWPMLNFVDVINFGVVTDDTAQHDPELQLNSTGADCGAASCGVPIDSFAASLDISLEFGQQFDDAGLEPHICCAHVMAAMAG